MKILALESSCDDTAAAIVENGRRVLANVVYDQNKLHQQYGGVIPEVAARHHVDSVHHVVQEALTTANLTLADIDGFAATLGPGLIGSLLVGANVAKTLSLITGKPFLGVHHLYAHVCSNYLESDLTPPFLCLLVSGGHTQLIRVQDYAIMEILGETLDDAVGEAYDKVGRLLDVGFPGGPAIDRLAQAGDPKAYALPTAKTKGAYDFSFSGLKTAMLRTSEAAIATHGLTETLQQNLAASFQHTVVKTLYEKTLACARDHNLTIITIAGGVSANRGLRDRFQQLAQENPAYRVFFPAMAYCTDNAAMVAASAYFNPLTTDPRQEVFSRALQPLLV